MAPSFLSWLFGPWGCRHCQAMHRRAQAAESAAARAVRQNDTARLWQTVANLRTRERYWRRRVRTWKERYRAGITGSPIQLPLFRPRVSLRGIRGTVLDQWHDAHGSHDARVKFDGSATWVGEGQALRMRDVSGCDLLVRLADCEVVG